MSKLALETERLVKEMIERDRAKQAEKSERRKKRRDAKKTKAKT